MVDPQRIKTAVTTQYLEIKRRQIAVIVDLPRFVAAERAYWDELAALLAGRGGAGEAHFAGRDPAPALPLRALFGGPLAAGYVLRRPALRAILEALVSRAYGEIHETRAPLKVRWRSVSLAFPRAFRRHLGAFRLFARHHAARLCVRLVRHPRRIRAPRPFWCPFRACTARPPSGWPKKKRQDGPSTGMKATFSAS